MRVDEIFHFYLTQIKSFEEYLILYLVLRSYGKILQLRRVERVLDYPTRWLYAVLVSFAVIWEINVCINLKNFLFLRKIALTVNLKLVFAVQGRNYISVLNFIIFGRALIAIFLMPFDVTHLIFPKLESLIIKQKFFLYRRLLFLWGDSFLFDKHFVVEGFLELLASRVAGFLFNKVQIEF